MAGLKKETVHMAEYTLVWADDFGLDGKPDPAKWTFETGGHGWGNGESQFYVDSQKNAFVQGGSLFLKAFHESHGENQYTSAKITTYGKAAWQYGKFEIRAKLPRGKGSWPAIWMMPVDSKQGVRWPLCGEIDIMEHVGWDENKVHVSLHTDLYNHQNHTQRTASEALEDVFHKFHVYGMEWTDEKITFTFDGREIKTWTRGDNGTDSTALGWPFDKPYYIILNIAVGGFWGGEIDNNTLPYTMEVDYVHVYQKL